MTPVIDFLFDLIFDMPSLIKDFISYMPTFGKYAVMILILICIVLTRKETKEKLTFKQKKLLKSLAALILISIFFIFVYEITYFEEVDENKLVVAVAPFFHSSISENKVNFDTVTAKEFIEVLEAGEIEGLEVILLEMDSKDINDYNAYIEVSKFLAKKKGTHILVCGETNVKMGGREEVKYSIYPISLHQLPHKELESCGYSDFLSVDISYSPFTNNPFMTFSGLHDNFSSAIFAIGAFKAYENENYSESIVFLKSIDSYDKNSVVLF